MVTDCRVLSKSVHVSKKRSLSSVQRIQSLYFQHVVSLRWVTRCCRAPRCPRCLPTILHCSRRGRGFLAAAAAATLCGDATGTEFTSVSFLCGVSAGRLLPQVVSARVEAVEVLPGGRLDGDEALSAVFLRGRVRLQTGSDVSSFYRQERSSGGVTKLSEHVDQR